MATIFVSPIAITRRSDIATSSSVTKKKRKRDQFPHRDEEQDDESHAQVQEQSRRSTLSIEEYTAVVSPEERSQRRVAGQPLSQPPPPPPFPHAKPSTTKDNPNQNDAAEPDSSRRKESEGAYNSLHAQHMSCLMTVLHKSLQNQDFKRAGRALGLILREGFAGHDIDIRAAGNWAVGAEILLRQHEAVNTSSCPGSLPESSTVVKVPLVAKSLEDVKAYYEYLIVQYPYHRVWPEAINSIDFYLAMFNVWIYVAVEQSKQRISEDNYDSPGTWSQKVLQAKRQELSEADKIAAEMEKCLSTVPYRDHLALKRLGAMVTLWQADLNDECQQHTETPLGSMLDGIVERESANAENSRSPEQYAGSATSAGTEAVQVFGTHEHSQSGDSPAMSEDDESASRESPSEDDST